MSCNVPKQPTIPQMRGIKEARDTQYHILDVSDFKSILSDLMACHDLSQRELAAEIGVSNATISRLVTGKSKYPDVEVLISMADYFGVTTDYLLGREQ